MPINPLAAALSKLALNDKPLISAATDKASPAKALKFEVGQQLQGAVQTQTAPGQFQVRIADQLVQMQLPAFVRSGDTISLKVTALQPNVTFALLTSANPISTAEQLSSASKLLSSMSQQPLEQRYTKPIEATPLWAKNEISPDINALAGKLNQALSHSGLFYESHQAQWIAGMRSTPQLLQEPQNQLTQSTSTPPANTTLDSRSNTLNPQTSPANLQPTPLDARAAIPTPLQTLVQQQLHALETHQVLWQGQAWEGQEMRWEVREETPRHQTRREQEPEAGQWTTEIQLDLPHLGTLSARLNFSAGAVNLTLIARNEATRTLMGNASTQLVSALNQRDIHVLQTRIETMEPAQR
ncbi:MAG: flagellar hook-length control protein FliK [Sideroxydans sp.]|nr:flagellar hook-length control protein FliK [Sideroxydans sp.]